MGEKICELVDQSLGSEYTGAVLIWLNLNFSHLIILNHHGRLQNLMSEGWQVEVSLDQAVEVASVPYVLQTHRLFFKANSVLPTKRLEGLVKVLVLLPLSNSRVLTDIHLYS